MIKTTVKIDGMMCGMCESHIADAIRNAFPEAKKVSASKSKGEASFLSDYGIDEEKVKETIEKTGYMFIAVSSEPYEKKGLFGGFRNK